MQNIKAVIFDVDGVLLDSLEPHLRICRDKNVEYSLGLTIPSAEEFKGIVRSGKKISPMKYFFLSVGFPKHYADLATDYYNEYFMKEYAPKPFDGLDEALKTLKSENIGLGLVTSNVKSNILCSLSEYLHYFPPNCILAKEDYAGDSKADAILLVTERLGVLPTETLYVGDQIADKNAADDAGVQFVGVNYGWGFSGDETEFPVYESTYDIAKQAISQSGDFQPSCPNSCT